MASKEETGAGLESFSTRTLDAEVIFLNQWLCTMTHHLSAAIRDFSGLFL
jgi:hypothetical protein